MTDAPELTSITRNRTIRPLLAAWVLVIVVLATGFVWLSLSWDPAHIEGSDVVTDVVADQNADPAPHEQDITIATSIPPTQTEAADEGITKAVPDLPREAEPDEEPEQIAENISLVRVPIDGLTVRGANGLLPVLGPDSMVAWKEYARPDDSSANDLPKVAILITGIGLNSKSSDMAIKRLPGQIDLGFSPYGRSLQKWMNKGREYGHEGFLMIPAEPLKYPENDPGPHTLLTGASTRDNLKKLDWLLSQVTGYVGVVNEMGSKFTASEPDIMPILEDLNGRGLMFLDARSTRFSVAAKLARRIAMPRALNNLYIDHVISSAEIARNLATLENTARTYGAALGVAQARPLTIDQIEKWAKDLKSRGIELVPITAIANRQPIR